MYTFLNTFLKINIHPFKTFYTMYDHLFENAIYMVSKPGN